MTLLVVSQARELDLIDNPIYEEHALNVIDPICYSSVVLLLLPIGLSSR